ncbi:MAG: NAD(P)-dependent oxidoreductase [Acetobacteraceae bacterium]|nr:NAD(P)-dependent oxidoreductase [Acetobacteraceae bacterium]
MSRSDADGQQADVGVIGLGHMGDAFAQNLMADGHRVMVFDRRSEIVDALAKEGAIAAAKVQDFAACKIVLTSLPDDDAVASVTDALIPALGRGAVHVSTSTISAGLSRRLTEKHRACHQGYIALPVLGNPDLAHHREIYLLAAGAPADIDRVRAMVERLGRKLFVIGEEPALANLMKLGGNALTAATLQSMGEVLALLRKCGISAETAFEVLTGSLFDGKVHKSYGGRIARGEFHPGMTVRLAAKDLRLALAEAENAAVPMPVTAIVRDRLIATEAVEGTDLDWSALGKLAATEAGLKQ